MHILLVYKSVQIVDMPSSTASVKTIDARYLVGLFCASAKRAEQSQTVERSAPRRG